jgi:NAD(P)-dependent dehydrogenase (short-subunit alcohol dehydrogenase family)
VIILVIDRKPVDPQNAINKKPANSARRHPDLARPRRELMNLSGKVAIVTGGGRGLGLAYVRALAGAGAAVVINDVDAAAAETAAAAVTGAGGRAVPHAATIGSSAAANALIDRAVAEFGRLDILVTNAGILRDTVVWKMTDEQFDVVLNVHVRGTFTCVRAAASRFREQGDGGRIICIGSPTGQTGNFGQTNYAAAKAAIVGMVRTWSLELARAGVTVNAVIPVAATAMTETVPFLRPYVEALAAGQPLPPYARRELGFGPPQDAAGLVVFLASDESAGITGQAIGIGGDRLALWTHPAEVAVAFADGDGWSADAIAEAWPSSFAPHQQSAGQNFPEPQR